MAPQALETTRNRLGNGNAALRPESLPLHPRPAVQAEALLGQVARLVTHLFRPLDPIAEIDMGQAEPVRLLDMIENDEAPERPARDVGFVEGIDQRQAIGEAIGQADREQWP
jgi:hypothetical protein